MEYCGLENGQTYNIIVTSVQNGIESDDSEILTFTFRSGGNAGTTIPYYSDAWWLPDFGALFGFTPLYHNNTGKSTIYYYMSPYQPYAENYYEILRQIGFQFDPDMSNGLAGDSFNVPMYFYLPGTEYTVVTDVDPDTGAFVIFTLFP